MGEWWSSCGESDEGVLVMRVFVLGIAVGYVLGSRAGRERYEQLVRAYRRVADHPMVQGAAGVVRAKLGERFGGDRQQGG